MSRLGLRVAALLDWLAPLDCAGCSKDLAAAPRGSRLFCTECALAAAGGARPRVGEAAGVPVLTLAPYGAPWSLAIRRLKYGDRPDLASRLGAALAPLLRELGGAPALIPVPMPASRRVARGYNQAALLARGLARATGSALVGPSLERLDSAGTQVGRGRAERLRAAEGAFRAIRPVEGRIALVDDVVTTGATASACVDALRRAGADVAGVIALARAPDRAGPPARDENWGKSGVPGA